MPKTDLCLVPIAACNTREHSDAQQWRGSRYSLLPIQDLVRLLLKEYGLCILPQHQKRMLRIDSLRRMLTHIAQIFMSRRDLITCLHEPFGDAFYYGPEKISRAWLRWQADKIEKTGRAHYTYDYVLQTILDTMKVEKASVLFVRHRSPRETTIRNQTSASSSKT